MAEADNQADTGKKLFVDVDLEEPIVRGEQTIAKVQLRRPKSGELRGLSMVDLVKLEVTAVRTLTPRISNPTLTLQDMDGLDPADLLTISTEIAGFFLPKGMSPDSLAP